MFELFLSHLEAFCDRPGLGIGGLGEPLGAQHAWLDFAGEAEGSDEKDNLLPPPPGCPREGGNDTGVKLTLLWGAARGQPSGPVCSRFSCWPLSFHELVAQGAPSLGFILNSGMKQLVQIVRLGGKLQILNCCLT